MTPAPDKAAARRARLAAARLYLCTDAREEHGDLREFLDAVLANGVDIVQLRQKGMEAKQELRALEVFAEAAEQHGALFAVNDRADVAFGASAHVLHLGQDDLPVALARGIVGDAPVIGRSCHAEDEVDEAAVAAGVDYFCAGPVWPTPTKPGRFAPGLSLVSHAARVAPPLEPGSRPWFAIGGIDLRMLDEVLAAGARRIVVVRAITQAADPGEAAAELAKRVRERDW